MSNKSECLCQTATPADSNKALQKFESIRAECSALQEILVPNHIWPEFKQLAGKDYNEARHQYILLGALKNGFLSKITFPIHRFLLDKGGPKINLTNQYRKDLVEQWMLENNPLERHRKSRIFQGKLAELLAAAWIEDQGWKIHNLEALGGEFDIEATSADNASSTIEVKYIGQEDVHFEKIMESLTSGNAVGGSWGLYDGYNFFLFKAYDAAKQLSSSNKARLGFIIICNMAWGFFEMPIKDDWISNRPLTFSNSASSKWQNFIAEKKKEKKFSNIENDLNDVISQLNELWIIEERNQLNYSLERIVRFKES